MINQVSWLFKINLLKYSALCQFPIKHLNNTQQNLSYSSVGSLVNQFKTFGLINTCLKIDILPLGHFDSSWNNYSLREWKCNFPSCLEITRRPTNQQTNRQTDSLCHRKISYPIRYFCVSKFRKVSRTEYEVVENIIRRGRGGGQRGRGGRRLREQGY